MTRVPGWGWWRPHLMTEGAAGTSVDVEARGGGGGGARCGFSGSCWLAAATGLLRMDAYRASTYPRTAATRCTLATEQLPDCQTSEAARPRELSKDQSSQTPSTETGPLEATLWLLFLKRGRAPVSNETPRPGATCHAL